MLANINTAEEVLSYRTTLEAKIRGVYSTTATPETAIFRLRWGGVGGVLLAQSAALALPASQTNSVFRLMAELTCRAPGATGQVISMGDISLNGLASDQFLPPTGPAVAAVNTNVAGGLTVTVQFSVANAGISIQAHMGILTAYDK